MYQPFIIELKNAALARKKEVTLPYANMHKAIAKVLAKEGFVETVKEEEVDGKKRLLVSLRYTRRRPAITGIELISKPSLRVYAGQDEILPRQGRAAILLVSTPLGVMTGKEAHKKRVGGELLFKVW